MPLLLDGINTAAARECYKSRSLLGDPQAVVHVSVEISAEFPAGVADATKRAVSENAASLGFKNRTWE